MSGWLSSVGSGPLTWMLSNATSTAWINQHQRKGDKGEDGAVRTANLIVGVGITIAHDPLPGSGRAGFPHPALALGDNAHAPQRIGMTDRRQRQPASDEAPHAIPEDAPFWLRRDSERCLHICMTLSFITPRRFIRRTGETK